LPPRVQSKQASHCQLEATARRHEEAIVRVNTDLAASKSATYREIEVLKKQVNENFWNSGIMLNEIHGMSLSLGEEEYGR